MITTYKLLSVMVCNHSQGGGNLSQGDGNPSQGGGNPSQGGGNPSQEGGKSPKGWLEKLNAVIVSLAH